MPDKKILVVEDEPSLLQALVKKLGQEGFDTLTARDGVEGLKIAKDKKPDLILLDIIMPKMDGMTMLSKLRAEDWGKDMPVIMLTNLNDAEKVSEAAEKGVFDFLVKTDWHINDVVAKIKSKLQI